MLNINELPMLSKKFSFDALDQLIKFIKIAIKQQSIWDQHWIKVAVLLAYVEVWLFLSFGRQGKMWLWIRMSPSVFVGSDQAI